MENLYNNESQLNPHLHLHGEGVQFLTSAAKWAKFMAIVSFIACGFMVLGALTAKLWLTSLQSALASSGNPAAGMFSMSVGLFTVTYLISTAISFFIALFLYRFAQKALEATRQQDNQKLAESMGNLRNYFKINGIILIIGLAFVFLLFPIILIAGIALAAM